MKQIKTFLFYFGIFIVCGCETNVNKDKIIGSWEAPMNKEARKNTASLLEKSHSPMIVMTFSRDLTVKVEIIKSNNIEETHLATYELSTDQKELIVYREGNKKRKNIAEILSFTNSEMILLDKSGTGDTLILKRK